MNTAQIFKLSLLQDLSKCALLNGYIPPPDLGEAVGTLDEAAKLANENTAPFGGDFVESIFSALVIDDMRIDTPYYYSHQALNLEEGFFPKTAPERNSDWLVGFKNDFKRLEGAGMTDKAFAETLLHLMHKYFAATPSTAGRGVSLYDFAKAKAGIAVCLWRYEKDERKEGEMKNIRARLLLVGGGVNGIQTFLYDIVGKNASKNLKGRSHYLHLLVDSVIREVLASLNLFECNIVVSSGGEFTLMAPNTLTIKEKIEQIGDGLSERLFEAYKTVLTVDMAYTDFSNASMEETRIGSVQETLHKKLSSLKYRRHQRQMLEQYTNMFVAAEEGGDNLRDSITGDEVGNAELYVMNGPFPDRLTEDSEDNDAIITLNTAQQIFLGKALRDCRTRIVTNGNQLDANGGFEADKNEFRPGTLAPYHYIMDDKYKGLQLDNANAAFIAINDLDAFSNNLGRLSKNPDAVYGFELYGGNDFPSVELEGEWEKYWAVKTFSELAGMAETSSDEKRDYVDVFKEEKFKRLAVLRMDVDDLGYNIRTAFKTTGSIAQYYALSRQLDWFFKGYLNTLWREGKTPILTNKLGDDTTTNWRDHVQITYAGGDDLFIVGKWDCVLDFAIKIREEFKKWTCHHPAFDLSGGVSVVTPKFPIYAAATAAGKDEKKAKVYQLGLTGREVLKKRAFTLFGRPLNWDYEMELVRRLREDMTNQFRLNRVPAKALIQQIQNFDALREYQESNNLPESWRWQFAYQIQRSIERYNTRSEGYYAQMQQGVFFNRNNDTKEVGWGDANLPIERSYLYYLSIASRWLEFGLRVSKSEHKAPINTHKS